MIEELKRSASTLRRSTRRNLPHNAVVRRALPFHPVRKHLLQRREIYACENTDRTRRLCPGSP